MAAPGVVENEIRDPDPEREELLEWVKEIPEVSDHTHRLRRMAKALRALGHRVGRYQARSLMREAGVWVRYRRRYPVSTRSNRRKQVFPNRMERDFAPRSANRVWARNSSCPFGLGKAGCTWRWSSTRTRARWWVGRWGDAWPAPWSVTRCRWRWGGAAKGQLIHHSERGVQYASDAFRKLLKARGIESRTSRKGDCRDNAVVESFFGSLKSGRKKSPLAASRPEALMELFELRWSFSQLLVT